MRRIDGVEGIRGIAALWVLVFHTAAFESAKVPGWAQPIVSRGWLGVPLFFVLSGLLLYRPFAHATVTGSTWPSLRRYARSRFLRIFPAYWLALSAMMVVYYGNIMVLLAWALVGSVIYARRRRLQGVTLATGCLLMMVATVAGAPAEWQSNAWPILRQYLMLQPTNGFLIGPAWTLQIELAFYLTLPLLALLLARAGKSAPRRQAALLALIAIAGTAGRWPLAHTSSQTLLLPTYLSLFAVGMLLALLLETQSPGPAGRRAYALAAVGAAAAATTLEHVGPRQVYMNHGDSFLYQPLMTVAFALAIAAIVTGDGAALRILRSRLLTELGVISYGIYLWHFQLGLSAKHRHGFTGVFLLDALLLALLTIICAEASWRLLERRALQLKMPRLAQEPRVQQPVPARAG